MMKSRGIVPLVLLYFAKASLAEQPQCCPNNTLMSMKEKCQTPSGLQDVSLSCEEKFWMEKPEFDEDGYMYYYKEYGYVLNKDEYCIGEMQFYTRNITIALWCFPATNIIVFKIYSALGYTSFVFFAIIFIIYAAVPETRNLHGRCIMILCGVSGFSALLNGVISSIQIFDWEVEKGVCQTLGFTSYFLALCIMFWLSIVMLNITKTIKFRKWVIPERKLLYYYCTYGFLTPFLIVMFAIILRNIEGGHMKMNFHHESCYLTERDVAAFYYFSISTTILLTNVILFCVCANHVWNKKNYDNVLILKSVKYKLSQYIKLFLFMGLIDIIRSINFAAGRHENRSLRTLIILLDEANGILYFLILVIFRKKILKALARGLHIPCVSATDQDDEGDEELVSSPEDPVHMSEVEENNL